MIERNAIDKILNEQNFANSDRVDPTTAAKIGKVLGVDAVVMGSITECGRGDEYKTFGGGAVGGVARTCGIGGLKMGKARAVVGVAAGMLGRAKARIVGA